ncbi:MAG: hypothetical protein ABJA57_00210 [Ginsengibacter sp.]
MRTLKICLFVILTSLLFPFCKKEFSLEEGIKKFGAGDWEFKEGGVQFVGPVDTAYILKLAGNKKSLNIEGTSLNGQQRFYLHVLEDDSLTNGTFKASLMQADLLYKSPAKTIYQADQLVGEFVINIINLSDNHITGTFSGDALDSLSGITTITEGKFSANINLANNTGIGGTASTGNLGSAAGSCTPVVISGSYTKGIAMDSSNNILVQVNVTKAGNYNISTNLVNGVKFSSSGSFAITGMQNVLLQAVGIPANAGNQVFTVSYGAGGCNFSLNFATNSASLDYFPTTANSNWKYSLIGGGTADSLFIKVMTYSPTIAGNDYKSLNANSIPPNAVSDTQYYRKAGADYFQYIDFSTVLPFDGPVLGEYIFLKDDVPMGTTWQSSDFSGFVSTVPVTLNIKMTILEKSVPVTIGSKNFADVIKVKYEYFVSLDPTTPVGTEERWFARGVGLIHDDLFASAAYDIAGFNVF